MYIGNLCLLVLFFCTLSIKLAIATLSNLFMVVKDGVFLKSSVIDRIFELSFFYTIKCRKFV